MAYHPDARTVPARALLPTGWITATFRLPLRGHWPEYLSHEQAFLAVTDVEVDGRPEPIPYLSIRKDAISVILPTDEARWILPASPGPKTPRRVLCFFERGAVSGTLHILEHVRVSDFFHRQGGFVTLTDARVSTKNAAPIDVRAVLVNSARLLAVSDALAPSE